MKFNNRPDDNQESTEDWLTTYSDLVTLLLAFFVLLFSFSEVDAKKWERLVESFTGEMVIQENSSTDSILDDNTSVIDPNNFDPKQSIIELENEKDKSEENPEETNEEDMSEKPQLTPKDNRDDIQENDQINEEKEDPQIEDEEEIPTIEEEIDEEEVDSQEGDINQEKIDENFEDLYLELIEYNNIEGLKFEISKSNSEIRIRLSNNLLFSPEKADIYENSTKTLTDIVLIIKNYDDTLDKIIMEGNTDSLPIKSGRYRDNFELSIERALNVLYFFKYEGNFQPEKLIPMGYGEFNPVATNDTVEGRAENRRTDILLIKYSSQQ